MTNVAVLLAGGVGSRIGLEIPKQLINVAGRTLLEHTLAALHDHPDIDSVIIMMARGHLDAALAITGEGLYPKVSAVLEGGESRNETTERAIHHIRTHFEPEVTRVLLHDAVRPLVTPRIISDCLAALDSFRAVDVAIPSADTVIEVDEANQIRSIPSRATLRRGQTPQAFHLAVLIEAYERSRNDPNFSATDDCGVVLKYLPTEPITVVDGDERNIKVTEPIDVAIADKLFQVGSSSFPSCQDSSESRREIQGKNLVVIGGSYGIGAAIADIALSLGANVAIYSRSSTSTDVARRSDVAAAALDAEQRLGSVDFVVNTAAVLPRSPLLTTSDETLYAATETNYLGPIFVAQEFYPLLERTGGALLLFTSSSYTRGRAGYSLYSSAKAAVVNLTQALADEWAGTVRVNCINPERTATPMRSRAFGYETAESLLDSNTVAARSIDVLLSAQSGHVYDVRLFEPTVG